MDQEGLGREPAVVPERAGASALCAADPGAHSGPALDVQGMDVSRSLANCIL